MLIKRLRERKEEKAQKGKLNRVEFLEKYDVDGLAVRLPTKEIATKFLKYAWELGIHRCNLDSLRDYDRSVREHDSEMCYELHLDNFESEKYFRLYGYTIIDLDYSDIGEVE